VTTGARV